MVKSTQKNHFSLVSGIIFFVIGLILFTNPDTFVKFISYCFGGVLILIGIYKSLNYYIQDKRLKVVNRNEIAFGITSIILGIVFIFLASAIELLLRFIIGGYLLIIGLGKVLQTFYTTDRTSRFYALIVVGLVFMAAGIYTIVNSNLPLKIIGLFMVVYGLIDFISYFIYRNMLNSGDKVQEVELMSKEEVENSKSKKKRK